MRIVAFTKYPYEGPSSRYRFYNYRDCFMKAGIDMKIAPFFSSAYFSKKSKMTKTVGVAVSYFRRLMQLLALVAAPRRYSLVLVEYELFPYLPAFFEWLLHKRGIVYIADYDDAVFHRYDRHRSGVVRRLLGGKIARVMEMAGTVIVCNAYLERYARQHNAKTLRLPTVVLLDRYRQAMKEYRAPEKKPFTIGWIGSKSTSVYLLDILPAVEAFASRYDAVFNFVGFDDSVLPEGVKSRCRINAIPWSEETEIKEILNFDIGIMPLRSDPWSQGKCGFKLVQYMSCKKPVIASPVGINTSLVEDGVNGYLAETPEEWLKAFEALYRDENLRKKMSDANDAKMLDEYNHAKNCKMYIRLIHESVGK